MVKCFFTIKSNSLQRNISLHVPLSFYDSLLFAIQAVLVSEHIIGCRLGILLKISDTCI